VQTGVAEYVFVPTCWESDTTLIYHVSIFLKINYLFPKENGTNNNNNNSNNNPYSMQQSPSCEATGSQLLKKFPVF
jgi:hypothetical protein